MLRKSLVKKWNSNPQHHYDLTDTYNESTTIDGRPIDVLLLLSGRGMGKSFTVTTEFLMDAWYDELMFAYVRRNDATAYQVEQYFADKEDFIKDMTDGSSTYIACVKTKLYFAHNEIDDEGKTHRILDKECGQFFALSRQQSYKSLQYPQIYNLVYEEVFAEDEGKFLQAEPSKLLNLISTIKRDKKDFKSILISNLVSPVSPYSLEWGLQIPKLKPGDINLTKLYLGSYKDGSDEEDYIVMGCHYLKDIKDLSKDDLKKKRNRIRIGMANNRWEERTLYPTLPKKWINRFGTVDDKVIFEWDDMMFLVDIVEVPENIYLVYRDGVQPSEEKLPCLYIQPHTTDVDRKTRLYTNSTERFSPYYSRGFQQIYTIDKAVDILIKRGFYFGCDNITCNSFKKCFENLKSYRLSL